MLLCATTYNPICGLNTLSNKHTTNNTTKALFLLIKRSIRLGHTYCVNSMSHLYAQYIHRYGSEIRGTIHAQELKQSIQISWSPNQYMQFGLLW